jgi:DNA polymerase III alpha subunit
VPGWVHPPHVDHSERRFTLTWKGEQAVLWMGLGQVRDLRRSSIRFIVAEWQGRTFAGLWDLVGRVLLQTS